MDKETVKLFDSELKVMDVLWKEGDVPAKHVANGAFEADHSVYYSVRF